MSKSLIQTIMEVQQPLSPGEKAFKALHNPINHKDIVPGVTDQDHVFNGLPRREDPTSASYENFRDDDESVEAYDKDTQVKKLAPEKDKDIDEETVVEARFKKGEDVGKPGKNFAKIAMSAAKRYGSKEAGNKVAGAVLKKVLAKEATVDQSKDMQEPGSEDIMKVASPGQKGLKNLDHHAGTLRQRATRIRPIHTGMSEEVLDEKITKSTPTKDVIHDFVHSKNKKFAGKSTKERIKMALGASYAMKKEEVEFVDESGNAFNKRKKNIAIRKIGMNDRDDDANERIRRGLQSRVADKIRGREILKGITKEEIELDEAKRGRPSKNASPEGEEGGREHIIVQLRKAENLRGDKHVEFNDASKHKLPLQHVKTALNMHTGMKPIPKGEFEKRLAASHSSFMSAIKGEPAPKPKSKISLGSMKKESKEMTTTNVNKELKHDCATHVFHKEHGEGHCIPEMHTIIEISEGVGFVTHYDVMFEHGIVQNVPVQELQILESMMHGHAPKKKMKESTDKKSLAALAEPKNKVTKKDVLVGRGVLTPSGKIVKKEGWAKFAGYPIVEAEEMTSANVKKAADTQLAIDSPGKVNMQQDSIEKIKKDPLASKEGCELPPTQGNKSIGGDGTPSRVMGKYSMEESTEILETLYDSLNESNKAKFDTMLESEEGIEFLLQFAEKQGIA